MKLTLFKRKEDTSLSDKIIRMVPVSLEYPDDGRRICELKSNSWILCQKINDKGIPPRAYAIDFIDAEDVKEAIKKFMQDMALEEDGLVHKEFIKEKAKERFGERLT